MQRAEHMDQQNNTQTRPWYRSLAAAFFLALAAHPLATLVSAAPAPVTSVRSSVMADDGISTSRQNAITRAVKTCSPAIVGINITETRTQEYRDPFGDMMMSDPFFRRYFGDGGQTYRRQYEVHGLGSGFIVSNDGYIITNDHVAGNASKIVVTMTSGEKYDATIVGTDPVTDVALLKISGKNFPYLKLANSESVEVGEWAIAFGNPFGLFDINAKPTVTVGVVSNTGVDFTQPDEGGAERVYRGMIQTDAAISSGNSGGPLVNANGEAIGMNTVIYSTSQSARGAGSIGIGFSIPINRVKRIMDRLKSDGHIDRNFWTGMELQEIDDAMARSYGLKKTDGVLISQIMRNSPAEDAHLEPGDVIVAIDGVRIHRTEDVKVAILDGETDAVLRITVKRGDNEETLSLKLSARPRRGTTRN